MIARPTLPRVSVGSPNPQSIIAEAQIGGGRVYYARIVAATVASFGLNPTNGLGIHARITRTNMAQACSPSGTGNVSQDTDFGNRVVYYPTVSDADARPVEMPFWDVDFDRGIWIPKDFACQIAIVGGNPESATILWLAYESHELLPNEEPPPLKLTYQRAPVDSRIFLVDRPALPGTPLPSIPADVHGACTIETPMTGATITLEYGPLADDTPIPLAPGEPVSLSAARSVKIGTVGQYIFRIRL